MKKIASILSIVFTSCLVQGQFIALNDGGTVTTNLTAFSTSFDVIGFYNFGIPNDWSFNGPVGLSDDSTINSFLYREGTNGPLSFVTIFGKSTTGSSQSADSKVTLTGTSAGFAVKDDNNGNDTYLQSGPFIFEAEQQWSGDNTDGYAISDITGFSQLIQSIGDTNLDRWVLHSANEDDPFVLSFDTNLVISAVPEPSTIGIIGALFLIGVTAYRRRKKI